MVPPIAWTILSIANYVAVILLIERIVRTTWTGFLPMAVSPESMTALVESKQALATSEASARVGMGLSIMDSSIWVAVITGLADR